MGKAFKDSDKLVSTNPFEQFNEQLKNSGSSSVTNGKKVSVVKDSGELPQQTADNPLADFNSTLKKKSGDSVPALSSNENTEPSTSSSSGRQGVLGDERLREKYDKALSFVTEDFYNNLSSDAVPVANISQEGSGVALQQPMFQKLMTDPDALGLYSDKRAQELQKNIGELVAEQNKYVTTESTFTGPGMSSTSTRITNRPEYDRLQTLINQKKDYLKNLQTSVYDVVKNQLIEKELEGQKAKSSIGIPRDLGRKIVKYADKQTDRQLNALETAKMDIGAVPKADLERAGLEAWKEYLALHPTAEGAEYLKKDIDQWENEFDERNPEMTAARVRHKIGVTMFNNAGTGSFLFRPNPSISEIEKAAQHSDLTPSEMKVFETLVLPTEKANIGTDIPMSGFFNKFGEAFQSNAQGLGKLFRGDDARLQEGLNQELNTRFDEVGEYNRWQSDLEALQKKQADGGLSKAEQKQKNELQKNVDARNWWAQFWDGAGDITGQVAYQALLAKGAGAAGQLASKVPGIGAAGGLLSRAVGADNVNLFFTSAINSYDNHAMDAARLLPGKENNLARKFHAATMSFIEGLSENIFKDTKVLDAFGRKVAPDVAKLVTKVANREITEAAAQKTLKDILVKSYKPFAKSFVKSEVEESTEEAVVDLADGISQSVFLAQKFDAQKTLGNAAHTFLTTMAYSPFVSGAAAVSDARASAIGKSGLYQMATNPDVYRREVYRQLNETGGITQAEADEKLRVINTAASIAAQLPQGKGLDYPKRASYLTHRLNEALLQDKIDHTTDDVVKADLEKQLNRSKKIREGIYNGSVLVGDDLRDIATDEKQAEELNINRLDEVDEDSLPGKPTQEQIDLMKQWEGRIEKATTEEEKEAIDKEMAEKMAALKKQSPNPNNNEDSQQPASQGKEEEGKDVLKTSAPKQGETPATPSAATEETTQDDLDLLPAKQREKVKSGKKEVTPAKPTSVLNEKENAAIEAIGKKDLSKTGLRDYANVLKSDKATPEEKREALKGIHDQLTHPQNEAQVGQDLGKSADAVYDLGYENKTIKKSIEDLEEEYNAKGVDELVSLKKKLYPNPDIESPMSPEEKLLDKVIAKKYSDINENIRLKRQSGGEPKSLGKRELTKDEQIEAVKKLLTIGNKFKVDGKDVTVEPYGKHGGIKVVDSEGNIPHNMSFQKNQLENPDVLYNYSGLLFQNGLGEIQNKQNTSRENAEAVNPQTADVVYAPLSSINTDTKRFQPRGTDFSEESAENVVENFDDNVLDPIVIYKDKSGKDFVLSGHSRLEAHKRLSDMPDSDPRKKSAIEKGFQPGKVMARYFKGTEDEAIEFAERSNDRATKNKDYESAASLRRMRESGKTKTEIQARAKQDFGKNWRYINNLSYLNPNGKILGTLRGFEANPDKENQNKIEKAAQWIGAVRERLGEDITNAHENEMFDFLMDKSRSTKLERENDFIALVQNITGRFDFNPDEPLNLARIKNKSAAEVSHDQEEAEIKQEIKERQAELDNLNDRLNNPKNPGYVNPNSPDYADVLINADKKKQRLNAELTTLRKELLEHQQKKGKVLAENLNQFGLFDLGNLAPAEQQQLDEELKPDGITTQNLQQYEQSISDSQQNETPNTGNTQQAGPVPQGLQQPGNDEGTGEEQNQGGATVQGVADPELQAKIDKKNAALAKFKKVLKDNRGQLNVGVNPDIIAAGVELMVAYADVGLYKFRQIVTDFIKEGGREFFEDEKQVEALKGVYSYYRSVVPKEERKNFDNEDAVDEFIENELPSLLQHVQQEGGVTDYAKGLMVEDEEVAQANQVFAQYNAPVLPTAAELFANQNTKFSDFLDRINSGNEHLLPIMLQKEEEAKSLRKQKAKKEQIDNLLQEANVIQGAIYVDQLNFQQDLLNQILHRFKQKGWSRFDKETISDIAGSFLPEFTDGRVMENNYFDNPFTLLDEFIDEYMGKLSQERVITPESQAEGLGKSSQLRESTPESVTFKTATGETLTGRRIVVPGYEDMDTIAVPDGFEQKVYEQTTGMEIADVKGFSDEEIIADLVDQLNSKKFSVPKLMEKIYQSDVNAVGMQKRLKLNDSPSYTNYKEQKKAAQEARPFVYSEQEKAQINDIIDRAKAEGVNTRMMESMRDLRQSETRTDKMPIERFERLFESLKKQKAVDEAKRAGIPLPASEIKPEAEPTPEAFKERINQHYKTDMYDKLWMQVDEDLRNRTYEAWKKQIALYNKYGYMPEKMGDVFVITRANALMGTLNAKNEQRKANIKDDIAKLNAAIDNVNEWYENEFGSPAVPTVSNEVADPLQQQFNGHIQTIKATETGSEAEVNEAGKAAQVLYDLKAARGETNQIEEQAVRNIEQYLKSRRFGFNDYVENGSGWFDHQVPWLNREELASENKILPFAKITVGMGPNGKWTNGISLHYSSAGKGSGMDINGRAFDSRQEAMDEAIEQARAFFSANQNEFTAKDKTRYNQFLKWADSLQNKTNDTDTATNLEPNRPRTTTDNTVRQGIVSTEGSSIRDSDPEDGAIVITEGVQPASSPGLLPFDAVVSRAPGDTGLFEPDRTDGAEGGLAGRTDTAGSRQSDEDGVSPQAEPVFATGGTLEDFAGRTIEQKIEDQKAAESIPVVLRDLQNIRTTLPFLMKEQQEDVFKAENRFAEDGEDKLFGKAILFTNGTGTGKTLTGLGIAKRFIKQGKNNILVVVPSDAKAFDWMQEAQDFLQIPLSQLKDTKDAGRGPVVTTYANFRENFILQQRTFDLVLYDESHKINSNGQRAGTTAQTIHRQVTLSPANARQKAKDLIRYDQRLRAMSADDYQGNPYQDRKLLEEELYQETVKQFKKTKVVFLSATPFSYHDNLEYGDGYLFQITAQFRDTYDGSRGYNAPNAYNNFFIQNFGYRMRYNKLTQPEAGVDVDLLERQFTEGLKKQGVIVSRKLNVDRDYSRQFVIVNDGVGSVIDEGLNVLSDRDKFPVLSNYYNKKWTYLYKNRLMEALKARASVERIQKHLNLGRKVVVFHSYNEGAPTHPFNFNDGEFIGAVPLEERSGLRDDITRFEREYPQYANLDLHGLVNPIETITRAFPQQTLVFNGTIPKKLRKQVKADFNNDALGKDIIVVQMEAGKEGLSLHDKTGKHQRALIQLALPVKPTDAIQSEGRIYRTGNRTDAVIEYPILNLNFERFAYAGKIKDRVRTAENFALGEEARNMETAFKEGYINASYIEPDAQQQGKGGKQDDARMDNISEFDKAKTFYYKRGKRTARDKQNVQGDYYATPEPLGLKMHEWAGLVPNEKGLEPSAGHGAIARFFSPSTNNHFIEPNTDLRAELALNAPGETKAGNFEDLNIINKYDGIVMNPPFGRAGKLAMEHLEKAMGHLRDGGRIVALVPTGQMNDRLEAWQQSDKSNGFYIRTRILLPTATFERAGTQVSTQVLVIDKVLDEEKAQGLAGERTLDLSRLNSIKELFDELEDLSVPNRLEAGKYAAPVGERAVDENAETTSAGIPTTASVAGGLAAPTGISEVVKAFHAKQQKEIWVVKLLRHVGGEEFNGLRDVAKNLNGYYSAYKGQGAIPGFVFSSEAEAQKMQAAITGEAVPNGPALNLADRIRTWKLAKNNGALNSFIIPVPQLWNGAVEVVARAVEAGEALADALRKGLDYINQHYSEPWQKARYNREMMSELKARGTFQYNLTPEQQAQAQKILARVNRGENLKKEINRIREVYDKAKTRLTDPKDMEELEESYGELEDYLFHNLAAQEAEKTERIDLGLSKQTWWEKQKENVVDSNERVHTVQAAIDRAGLSIEEKNDMVNRADRRKSIAEAKINQILHGIGLADVDVFVWKGIKKIKDSLFDRMARAGIDFRQFNLYLYARHAPERNAHNAKIRRQALAEKIIELEGDIASKEADYQLLPSTSLQGVITRLKNQHELLSTYEQIYGDPKANPNYVKLLEAKVKPSMRLMDDGGSGMTNQQAAEILQEVEKAGLKDRFEAFETEFRDKVISKLLDLKKEYELIGQEDYDYLKGYYQNYIPLKVEDSYFDDGQTFAQQKLPGSKIFKSKGANYITYESRVNPMTQAIVDLQATVFEGEENVYKTTIANAILEAPDTKVWELQSALYAPVKDKSGRVLSLKEIKAPANGIPYMDRGQKKYLVIHDKALFDAISQKNVRGSIPVFSDVNNFFRQLFTVYNPAFTVSNLFRDLQTAGAILSSQFGAEVGKNFRANTKQIFSIIRGSWREQGGGLDGYWTERAKQYTDLGGNMSWFRPEVATEIISDIEGTFKKYEKDNAFETGKQLSLKLADFFNRANQAVETSTRLAIFDALLKAGYAPYKAVEIARNATINFSRKGNYGGAINSMYLFFNAGIQGSANMLYATLSSKRGKYVAGGIAAMGLIQSVFNNLVGDCSDTQHPENCYDNIPDYEKERNIIIKVPGTNGFLKIPLAYGFNVFWNVGESLGQMVQGKKIPLDAASFVAKTALNAFNPMGGAETPLLQQLSPTATDPVVQWFTNRDGLGRPIYNDARYDKRPDSEKGFKSDSEWSKDFSQWLNRQSGGNDKLKGRVDIAPGTMDFLFETLTGGTGQFLRQAVGSTQAALDPASNIEMRQIPVLNRFYTLPAERSDRSFIYDTLDDSYNSVVGQEDRARFEQELQKAVRLGEIKADKAQEYQKTFLKNQVQLSNPATFSVLEQSKQRILEGDEIQDFMDRLQELVDDGQLSEGSLRGYKATITKNQNKLKAQEEE